MRNQKGITLIALVVTIVVLLILAGTSIAMLGGDNGIITNAQDAAAANTEGEVLDKMNVAYNTVKSYVITKSSTLSDWTANDITGETDKSVELAVANVIVKEILPGEALADNKLTVSANGYTIKYTETTMKEGEPATVDKAGTVEITYTDKKFNKDNKPYSPITATITIKSDDVEYTRPERQVNQK